MDVGLSDYVQVNRRVMTGVISRDSKIRSNWFFFQYRWAQKSILDFSLAAHAAGAASEIAAVKI